MELKKFKIKYTKLINEECEITSSSKYKALEEFREDMPYYAINSIEYVYEGNEPLKDFYCIWWNGDSWEDKIVQAHNEDEIEYNIKPGLDFAVYNFYCCLNVREEIEKVHRSIWD